MPIPYPLITILSERRNPSLEKSNGPPKKQTEFLIQNSNMKDQYLGACLDSCRWGSMHTVMYEMNIKDMISFIQNWMDQNKDNFQNLVHERKIDDLYTKFELPHIYHEVCPRDKEHKGTIKDLKGRIRCAAESKTVFKPSFADTFEHFDDHAKLNKIEYSENSPHDPSIDAWNDQGFPEEIDKSELEKHQKELEKFEQEERILVVKDVCYTILSDKDSILSLETILKRLNLRPEFITRYCNDRFSYCKRLDELNKEERKRYENLNICPGHTEKNNEIEFPFDGWDLAFYVQRWYEQLPTGKVPLFEN